MDMKIGKLKQDMWLGMAILIGFLIVVVLVTTFYKTPEEQPTLLEFDKIEYSDGLEFDADCTKHETLCIVRGDSPKGWVVGFVTESDMASLSMFMGEERLGGPLKVVLNDSETGYVTEKEKIELFIKQILTRAAESSDKIVETAKTDPSVASYLAEAKEVTYSIDVVEHEGVYVWKVGFGSPAYPDLVIFVSLDGAEVI